ncbi:protein adenylyltransferase SelO-like isoform X2 [Myotis daubentonii]|uniref:protein adenylyltransferase SelO-like isoform X2 n=1 Tax=Myotis daubentonii TaxID=98922 RepID=UPI002872C2A8|nr:protein adenylyltransferase SelO-like isoform X2 [Myotis daubentonii]
MPPCARLPVTNFSSAYSDGKMTPRIGFPFCCLSRRLQIPRLLLVCVTCHAAAIGALLPPGLEGNARLLQLLSNKSNQEQGYCEAEARLALSLDFWTLSSENLIAVLPVDPVKENYVRKVKNCVFSIAFPTPFKSRVHLVAVSKEVLEDILDLDLSVSETDDFIQLVSGKKIVFGSIPLAHRYGGHQFGIWADQLGDGRAHLIGTYMNRLGEKWELQLKGSGKTPYSRNGDGRAVLRSSVREFLCSEAMYYLGIPTSRAASLVVSDDEVWRDQFYNGNIVKERGAVVLRVAKSWFRIGSLEILTHYGELDLLRTLLDFIIQEHFPSVDIKEPNRYVEFFSIVVSETAQLIALWMSIGFAHGVCNTDNFSLLSITIDYGPFGFMEAYNPDFVPNTSDDERRYKIGNQANIGMFNLNKLLQALNPLLDPGQKQLFRELFKAKLGLLGERKGDDDLIAFLLHLMENTEADFTMTFRQLSEITQSQLQELNIPQQFWALKMISKHELFPAWVSQYLLRLNSNMNNSDFERRKRMMTINPRYVLKNWMAESAVQKAERNDFSEALPTTQVFITLLFVSMSYAYKYVYLLQQVLQHPFQKHSAAEKAGYSSPTPAWARDLRVSCSS